MGPRFRMGRRRGLVVGAAVGATVANSRKQKNAEAATNDQSNPRDASQDTNQQFEELEKLGQLKDQGILTQEEFDAKKKQILGL